MRLAMASIATSAVFFLLMICSPLAVRLPSRPCDLSLFSRTSYLEVRSMLTATTRGLYKTKESVATPCSVKA
jgi:hypothetical protein